MATPAWAEAREFAEFLRANVDGLRPPVRVQPFDGGQSNPTYRITDSGGGTWVLRKKPEGELLPSAHAVDREYRVMKALAGTGVPVPRMLCWCEDASVIGTPFYVMEFVHGRVLWDPALPGFEPRERAAAYDDINRAIAALHGVDPAAVGLGDYGRPRQFFDRQVSRWTKQYRACETERIESMDRLVEWLPANMPARNETTIFHGDLRMDNFIVHPSEPRVLAILDWELSTLGDPLGDFAHYALAWRLTSEEFRGMAEHRPLPAGIPREGEFLRQYAQRTQRAIDARDYEYAIVCAMFRLAAILQGIVKRAHNGTASSSRALQTGMKARGIADAAWRSVQAKFSPAR